ncbi:MAG: amidohydrolase [Bacillota bacterium]|jgi:hypothetical protein
MFDLLLKGCRVIDPANNKNGLFDVAIADGVVAAVEAEISPERAKRVLDVSGSWAVPGVIDLHVHSSTRHRGQNAHRMLAKAGVCTALDTGGPWDEFMQYCKTEGAGLNMACLQQVREGLTVSTQDPSMKELRDLRDRSMEEGALGLKLLGGHYPLTPEASRRVIEVANEAQVYIMYHSGSTLTGSNIEGFRETVQLAKGLKLHIPHINSYCRGQKQRSLDEITEALGLLMANRNIVSESYLATINGTSGFCIDGVPESKATQQCLILAGYEPTEAGLEAAILAGYARVNVGVGGENINMTGPEAVKHWRARNTLTSVNFPVNTPESRFLAATMKDSEGNFVVDAFASDGGAHPRNVTVTGAMALVKLEALTPEEMVHKTSLMPARMLGCFSKGHLGEGSDADITGIDPVSGNPIYSIVGGKLVLWRGALVGSGTTIITTEQGAKAIEKAGLPYRLVDVPQTILYAGR